MAGISKRKRIDKIKPASSSTLMVRLDEQSKAYLAKAAELRKISLSDYVRTVTVAQAMREVQASRKQTIYLSPEEQLLFWTALQNEGPLTAAQKELSALMRKKE